MEYEIAVEVDEAYMDVVDAFALEAVAASVLRAEGVEAGALSVVVTSDEEVRALNQTYRGVDAPTDVLSFAAQEGDESDQAIVGAPPELQALLAQRLGDVIIAYPYAAEQAVQFGNSTAAELLLLTAHGVLHLLGYDHATPAAEAAMWQRQEEILIPLGITGLSMRRYEE